MSNLSIQKHLGHRRSTSSLVHLTRKFVTLLRKAKHGVVDLKYAAQLLGVQKRRIYDITNVLEGIGLIAKQSHSSCVQWNGRTDTNPVEEDSLTAVLETYEEKRKRLKQIEDELDLQIKYATRNIQNIRSSPVNQSFAYVTRDDLVKVFGDSVILSVQNYKHYEMPLVQINGNIVADRFMCVKSESGSMVDVRLVTQDGDSTVPKEDVEKIKQQNQRDDNESEEKTSTSESDEERPRTRKRPIGRNLAARRARMKRLIEKRKLEERKLAAKIILRNAKSDHSLRRYFPNDETLEMNSPLLQINPPKRDFLFVLNKDEGVSDLFDLSC